MLYPVFLRRHSLTNHLSCYQSPFLKLPRDTQWKKLHSLRISPWASTSINSSQPDPQGSKQDPQIYISGSRSIENWCSSSLALLVGHHKQVTSLAAPVSTPAETWHVNFLFYSEWKKVETWQPHLQSACVFFFLDRTLGFPVHSTLSSWLLTTQMGLTQPWSWFFFFSPKSLTNRWVEVLRGFCLGLFFGSVFSQIHMTRIPHVLFLQV